VIAANGPHGDTAARVATVTADPGASLRAAVEAIATGDRERADGLLRAVAERHPIIADYADLLRMRLHVDAGDADGPAALTTPENRVAGLPEIR